MEFKDYELLMEHIPGAIAIDMEGAIIYLNEQCASYIGVDRKAAIGCDIRKVFPDTKMMQSLDIDKPKIVFYHAFGIGISVHVPIFSGGNKIGLLEYDMVQASELLYDLADDYTHFLDEELKSLKHEISELRNTKYSISNIIGDSEKIMLMKEAIINAAKSNSTVVIYGETGTGKELVAHSLHSLSNRARNNFVKINAASIPENLVESELFGYEGGTFTGAKAKGKKGKFELADKGTLFIDEINQMPLSVQPKLLRVLQENEIERIGGEESIPVNVKVIVTTNQDLRQLVEKGSFRRDLFYRLHVMIIKIPALRERKEDIPLLTKYFVDYYSKEAGIKIDYIDERIYDAFTQYNWPGNIRELQNMIARGMNTAKDGRLMLADMDLGEHIKTSRLETLSSNSIKEAKDDAERKVIIAALQRCDGNKTKTAEYLGIKRPLLYQKLARLGIDDKEFPKTVS